MSTDSTNTSFDNLYNDDDLRAELDVLSSSFKLLKATTDQVSTISSETSTFLKSKLSDTSFRFFSVIDSINDIVLVKDAVGRWKTLNKYGQKIFNFTSMSDYLGLSDLDLAEKFPRLADGMQQCVCTDKKAWENKTHYRDIEVFTVNGKKRSFDVIKTPIFYTDGEPKELIVIGRDITEMLDTERRHRTCLKALNTVSDFIILIDNKEVIIFSNDAFLRAFGFHNHTEVEGHSFNLIDSEQQGDQYFKNIWRVIRSNNIWMGEIISRHLNGELIHCNTTILPVMNGSPEPIYYICTMKIK